MSVKNAFDFLIQWHLTENCNLRCRHCYQTGKRTDEMSLSEVRLALDEISDTFGEWKKRYDIDFSPSFNVTGGEPFLRRDFLDILKDIAGRGFELFVLSNGTLIDEKKASSLSSLGVKGVQVSMEGPEDVHNVIRGKGTFEMSLRGVRHLLDAGLTVTLNVTLSSLNAGYFMEMVEISSGLGVQKLGFSRLVPSGRGAGMLNTMLSAEAVKELYGKIFSLETGALKIVTGDPIATQSALSGNDDGETPVPLGGCAAGVSGVTILPDGTIVPCRRLHIPIGNIRNDSLRELWATSEVLVSLRDIKNYKGKCGSCKRWSGCRGCRAIAYSYSQSRGRSDFLAEDPQCFIEA